MMRELFKEGVLYEALVVPAPMESNSWMVSVVRSNGTHEHLTTINAGTNKIYKRLPAALEDVRRVGFSEAKVQLPKNDTPIRK